MLVTVAPSPTATASPPKDATALSLPHAPSIAVASWLEVCGLSSVSGLFDCLLAAAPSGLDALGAMSDEAIAEAIAPLRLRPTSVTYKKLQSALAQLRGGARVGHDTSEASTLAAMPPPPRPRLGGMLGDNPLRLAALGMGGAMPNRRHSAPLPPAPTLADSTAEAAELSDLASLFGAGERSSMRPDNEVAVGKAQLKAQHLRAGGRVKTPTSGTLGRFRSRLSFGGVTMASGGAAASNDATGVSLTFAEPDEAAASPTGVGPIAAAPVRRRWPNCGPSLHAGRLSIEL